MKPTVCVHCTVDPHNSMGPRAIQIVVIGICKSNIAQIKDIKLAVEYVKVSS